MSRRAVPPLLFHPLDRRHTSPGGIFGGVDVSHPARHTMLLLAGALTLAGASACSGSSAPSVLPLQGTGTVATESRSVGSFTSVEVRHGIELQLVVGQPTGLDLSAQPNLMGITTATTVDGTLVLDTTLDYTSTAGIKAVVGVPSLDRLMLVGGAHGVVEGIVGPVLSIRTEGGAVLRVSGSTDRLTLRSDGGGKIDLGGLVAGDADIELVGGITAIVHATHSVSGSAVASVLSVRGAPPNVAVKTSAGSVMTTE